MAERILYPLTNPQLSIWQIEQFFPGNNYCHIAATCYIREPLNFELMQKAINMAVRQNESMRMRIVLSGTEPKQYFKDYEEQEFEVLDFSYPNGESDLAKWEDQQTRKAFQVLDHDLFYFALIKKSANEGAFYLKCHHILADAWGCALIVKQIFDNYLYLTGRAAKPAAELFSYLDYIRHDYEYRNSEKFIQHGVFWRRKFSTFPELTNWKQRLTGSNSLRAGRKIFYLDDELMWKIKKFCQENEISEFILFMSVLSIYLSQVTSKTDLVIGTPILNRSNYKEKNTIGMFVSNLPFRINLSGKPDFQSLAKALSREFRELLRHQQYPYSQILRDFRDNHKTQANLFDVVLSYQNAKYGVENIAYYTQWHHNGSEINSLTLHISDREETGRLCFNYDYRLDFFDEPAIDLLHKHLLHLLEEALTQPDKQISDLAILFEGQKELILTKFNDTGRTFNGPQTIHELFEEQVRRSPEKIAVICRDEQYTYDELNRLSNQLARLLRAREVGKDQVVGLLANRSARMIAGLLGILKAGAAYLPIDPEYPPERISLMLKNSGARLLVTDKGFGEKHGVLTDGVECLYLDDLNLSSVDTANIANLTEAGDLANLIYTSGSTGIPKAVMIEHGAVVNLIHALSEHIDFSPAKTVLSVTTVSFDIFFAETILPLVKGLRLILTTSEEQKKPELIVDLIKKYSVNFLQTTPSRMQAILKTLGHHSLPTLTEILLGGEALSESLVEQIRQVSQARIINGYGPTETTIYATVWEVLGPGKVPIGKPLANTQVYILDQNLQPVPIGVQGEIYIGGLGVARGYMGAEELTRERFIPNPFAREGRIYKTGDLGRWLPDGVIEYLGRNDHQVKIRGYRVELGEVEKCLEKHPLVEQAVVTCAEEKQDKKYLLAFFSGSSRLSAPELRAFLARFLPDYMIPAEFIWLEKFPLTPNGKIDRHALPLLKPVSSGQKEYVAPRNLVEQLLCQAWAKALEIEQVGIDDNLFILGGDSLTVVEIISSLLTYGWNISAQDFYTFPTVRELAAKILFSENTSVPISRSYPEVPARKPGSFNTRNPVRAILLTGATGFLGIHILDQIISKGLAKVYCLVRGAEGEERLRQQLEFYFPGKHSKNIGTSVLVVNGDILESKFGLAEEKYYELGRDVDAVVHAAALVKHYGIYDTFKKVNVIGTQEVIKFCREFAKELYHISTMSVSGKYIVGQTPNAKFTENDLFIGQHFSDNVYVHSKFEAEELILKAMPTGLNASIFRVGVLTGRYSDGYFQKNIEENAFYNRLRALVELGQIPAPWLVQDIEFTPVDCCAEAIIGLILCEGTVNPVYHLFNHRMVRATDLLKVLADLGALIEPVDTRLFMAALAEAADPQAVLRGFITDLSLFNNWESHLDIEVSSDLTLQSLERIGFQWPVVNREYLIKIFEYMHKVGFVKLPALGPNCQGGTYHVMKR